MAHTSKDGTNIVICHLQRVTSGKGFHVAHHTRCRVTLHSRQHSLPIVVFLNSSKPARGDCPLRRCVRYCHRTSSELLL